MFKLKRYQRQTLEALDGFLKDARLYPVADAFEASLGRSGLAAVPYRHYAFDETPYVCLRLPTGGGKTVLASHAIKVAKRAYLETEYPIVLWLVPTNAIRGQTLDALKTPGHHYRAELEREFGLDRLRVLDIGEVTMIRPQDVGRKAIVVVGTLATLRVQDTSGRKVYAYHEDFEPHFAGVDASDERFEVVREEDLKENGLGPASLGRIKYSFANLLALHGPLVIMDEAHNARTSLSFDTLKRIHPRCVIEFTATPDVSNTSASNVLYHVSASELKAEEMIKLPIVLTEHDSWQGAVRDAHLTREKLATEAQKDRDYIRPIVLIQAESRAGEVTVDTLKAHLMEELHIDEEKIAIATGSTRGLEGVDLFAIDCKIEYIITMEALKEGWDCSFAYVFCSVKDVRSSKDAEQLLGRVLRMPYARRRSVEALNRAYAHLASPAFSQAAQELTDKLVNMGFEALEVPAYLQHGAGQDLFGGTGGVVAPPEEPPLVIALPSDETVEAVVKIAGNAVKVTKTESGEREAEFKGLIPEDVAKELIRSFTGVEKRNIEAQIDQHNQRIDATKSPSVRSVPFAALPQLCMIQQGELELLEPESYLYLDGSWSLLNFKAELPGFALRETDTTFEVDVDGKSVSYRVADEKASYDLNLVDGGFTDADLVGWLDQEVRQPDVAQSELRRFLSLLVADLSKAKGFPVTGLIRSKFILARAIKGRIGEYRRQAAQKGFQKVLFDDAVPLETRFDYKYEFKPGFYPARPPYYQGRFRFARHYYPVIEDLKSDGEEFECAKAIDSHSAIKHWVRNLVAREHASFRLPLAGGWFYPDFVAELVDGRILVVEYKGAAYVTNDDSREKRQVGNLWAKNSGGKCLFLMAVDLDSDGRNVFQQINDAIS